MRSLHRRSIRFPDWDYTRAGAYFVTICTYQREWLLGCVEDATVVLSPCGQVVSWSWYRLARHFPNIDLDAFVVMPNHIHGVIVLREVAPSRGKASGLHESQRSAPSRPDALPLRRPGARPGSLSAIVQNLKSVSARRINQLRGTPGTPVWQRNYYERIIRNARELEAIRRYIHENPRNWDVDPENPAS